MSKKLKKGKPLKGILVRYLILVVVAIPNLYLFYLIFTPLTVYPVYFILNIIFGGVVLAGNSMTVSGCSVIEIIKACVAGSAYYLLLILNLSTPKIKLQKRIKMVLLSFASLLFLNIIRIIFLTSLYVSDSSWFDFTHKLFWYFLSIIFVAVIWFAEVKMFNIKKIPFYSDVLFLYKKSVLSK